jgi:hypothetical protein
MALQRKLSLSKAKKRAWKAFSLWIRNRGKDGNMNTCYTCGKKYDIKKLQAGHGIPGRTNAVLFMEDVVRPQCFVCNIRKNGNYKVFSAKLIEELGEKLFEEKLAISTTIVKYTVEDYLEIEKKYRLDL